MRPKEYPRMRWAHEMGIAGGEAREGEDVEVKRVALDAAFSHVALSIKRRVTRTVLLIGCATVEVATSQ